MAPTPKRYLQTGTAPSPPTGGATGLATATAPVLAYLATAPVAGQVLQAFSPTSALWATPASSGVVDDPTIRNANFTAVAGTRYFIGSSVANVQVNMPIGPADGDIVVLCGVGVGNAIPNVTGNGNSFQFAGSTGPSFSFRARNLDLAFRFTTATGLWESIDTSVSSLLYSGPNHAVVGSDSSGFPTRVQLSNGDSVLGRVGSQPLSELLPYNVAHNLYYDSAQAISDATVGSQTAWLPSVSWERAHAVYWQGATDLIVRGVYSNPGAYAFRADKLVTNDTGPGGTGTYRNIVWKNQDPATPAAYRIRHDAPAPSTDYADYVQGPGTTVMLRYHASLGSWVITAMFPSGAINRGVTTTDAVATIIHSHQTNLANRVIAYKVQVEALETAGTPGRAALYDIAALFHRDGAGLIVQKGATAFMATIEDNAAWDVTFTISGTIIEMRVTGDGTDTVQWRVVGNITEHG